MPAMSSLHNGLRTIGASLARFAARHPALVIVAAVIACGVLIVGTAPSAQRRGGGGGDRAPVLSVAVQQVAARPLDVKVHSYGIVQPRTTTTLSAQVPGQIVYVNPQFGEGGIFRKGDALLRLDARDYEADVAIQRASLLDAQQALAEEQVRSRQAALDWRKIHASDKAAPDLALRKPHLRAAEGRVEAARALLQKARLNLERATIKAPYDGRVLSKAVGLGQVVGASTVLGEIYATDIAEVRLPLKNSDRRWLPPPESGAMPEVSLHSESGGGAPWRGRLVRTEGVIDQSARQLHVVAQVHAVDNSEAINMGDYVTASIDGIRLESAIVIPADAIYQGAFVYVMEDGAIYRRNVEIGWQSDDQALIVRGLQEGDSLVTTPLGGVPSGTRARPLPDGGTLSGSGPNNGRTTSGAVR